MIWMLINVFEASKINKQTIVTLHVLHFKMKISQPTAMWICTLQVEHIFTLPAKSLQIAACPQGLNVTTASILQTKHPLETTEKKYKLYMRL